MAKARAMSEKGNPTLVKHQPEWATKPPLTFSQTPEPSGYLRRGKLLVMSATDSAPGKKRFPAAAKAAIVLALLIAAGLGLGGAYLNWLAGAPRRALATLAETLRTNHHEVVKFFLTVNRISPRSDLVLAVLDTQVAGEYASYKDLLGVDFGTTSLTFSVPVRYHYAVDIAGEDPIAFRLDQATGTLFLSVPPLRVLSAEADFGKLEKTTKVGWGRMGRFSGKDVERQFRERVAQDVREKGNRPLMRIEAEAAGRKELEALVRRFLEQAHPDSVESIKSVVISFDHPESVRTKAD